MVFWRYINILSLDVALGAMIGCAFFSRLFGVTLLPHAYLSLGLIVWIIYTVDHLVDARNSKGEPSTDRHLFHKIFHRQLLMATIVAGVVVALEVMFVRKPVLYAGLGVAMLVVGYLLLQASLKFVKELAGAILYTAGVVAGPWSMLQRPLLAVELGLIGLFAVTAYANLLLFSWFDVGTDERDGHSSMATYFGDRITRGVIVIAFMFATFLYIVLLINYPSYAVALSLLLLMNAVLFLTFRGRNFFRMADRYRIVGDLVFFIPGIYLLLVHGLEQF